MNTYPECEKLAAAKPKSQAQGEFLEWLSEQGYVLCRLHKEDYIPACKSTTELLAECHGIDMQKVEQERQTMLEEIRQLQP